MEMMLALIVTDRFAVYVHKFKPDLAVRVLIGAIWSLFENYLDVSTTHFK